ncbi:uncharacterized protein SPAPADRAFT_61489 [Spathaspora passalidarum NRRL Y-27907]|uniref:Zn(2)-C6 fungal-type domain-containing protein n=1 Tax=Spathaspora passalidarum (strain NRRL Y-27907 / 11-Y1) TaxID=619300 RepID=G3AN06_SPAPN|nr:uncharacterized protein SPAPADRAFT_61489 [Spathaspora passalidarum NRRL Y-27907]EGW32420.1 hypothetical protein SPAPADRAFT_61489 [Spathaspora passalidarum NRRL Y-27907]
MTSYRSYQQVLDISIKQKSNKTNVASVTSSAITTATKKITKVKKDDSNIKRRTKTGCLTCRKRKKKCDEDKVNGKCQGCTRNFLECCWPEAAPVAPATTKELASITKSPTLRSTKCNISSLLATPIKTEVTQVKCEKSTKVEPVPYPSPISSPEFTEAKLAANHEVNVISLPPLFNVNYKLQSKDSNVRGTRTEEVKQEKPRIITAPVTTPLSPPRTHASVPTKFVITSFNSHKDLCQIPN